MRQGSNFIILHMDIHLFQHCLWKRLLFSFWIVLAPLLKLTINVKIYLWTLESIPFVYMDILRSEPYLLNCYSSFEIRKWVLQLSSLFQYVLVILGSLYFFYFILTKHFIWLIVIYLQRHTCSPAGGMYVGVPDCLRQSALMVSILV